MNILVDSGSRNALIRLAAASLVGLAMQAANAASLILPANATPFGYSLDDMARLTAVFNESDRSGPPPESPFQILYTDNVTGNLDFSVASGTYFYLPIVFNDNAEPVIGDYPSTSTKAKILPYWYSQNEIGTVITQITLDGVVSTAGPRYVSAVDLDEPLPDGATKYMAPAVFIAPLPVGKHTVGLHFKATGHALSVPPFDTIFPGGVFEFETVYTVTVH